MYCWRLSCRILTITLLACETRSSSVQFSRSVVSDSLWLHESQHARPPCPSQTPRLYSNSCPLSRWYHPAISSSVVPSSSCPQSLPESGSFPMSQLFAWGGQSIKVSTSTPVLLMNTQDWSPSGWTGWISLQSKGLSWVFSNTTVQKHQFFGTQLSPLRTVVQYFKYSLALPFFGTGMETDIFQSCGRCWIFQICWHIECSTLTALSLRSWNSSAGILSSPLASFIVMLPKAHLKSYSRISGFRWVITPLWLSGSLRSLCTVLLCILAISC